MNHEQNADLTRTYNIYYLKDPGKVLVVYKELAAPAKDYKFVESLDHHPSQSYQVLRNRAAAAVAQFDPSTDIHEINDIKFIDEEPYGEIDTGKEDKHDEPKAEKPKKTRKTKTDK